MKKFLLLASLLLVIGCNNVETKNVTKKISKQESVDEPPKPGSIDYLIYKNGFKIFKLGDNIKNYSRFVKPLDLKKGNYIVSDISLLAIDHNIELEKIVINTKNDHIDKIFVFPYKKDAMKFLNTLIAAYGEPNENDKTSYSWYYKPQNFLLLYYSSDGNKAYAGAIFHRNDNINYAQLKQIRKIEHGAIKYVSDL